MAGSRTRATLFFFVLSERVTGGREADLRELIGERVQLLAARPPATENIEIPLGHPRESDSKALRRGLIPAETIPSNLAKQPRHIRHGQLDH